MEQQKVLDCVDSATSRVSLFGRLECTRKLFVKQKTCGGEHMASSLKASCLSHIPTWPRESQRALLEKAEMQVGDHSDRCLCNLSSTSALLEQTCYSILLVSSCAAALPFVCRLTRQRSRSPSRHACSRSRCSEMRR